ncbi:hypothetical protein BBBOND_0210350 [Babesia bigemina]|uniref:Uncharacterized protein n=1 Tax=Babesia bigemina TaxID=5866 RepID=A0A061D7C9_BABBI|nr:hypothetical protein BBBOND_0210350 [Babesia bigemina]CDR95882.1 hypothetical protein BBBOND_0210350 [Babesia bigemina]|eukprot:XP_012768068.1 hypothetical protein BBBOND_0210350 [Babesia bigemina]
MAPLKAHCVRASALVLLLTQLFLLQWLPVAFGHLRRNSSHLRLYELRNALRNDFANYDIRNPAVQRRKFALCVVNADAPSAQKADKPGILGRVWNTYAKIKDVVDRHIQKISDNRKKALSSTHPLRHQSWRITFHRKTGLLGLSTRTEHILIDFMEDGTLKTSEGHDGKHFEMTNKQQSAGNWWSEYGDVVWKIYFDPKSNVATYFNAQFSWNNFGEAAFMRRGVVYQDRPQDGWLPQYLFRPVIGKFTGEGIPQDDTNSPVKSRFDGEVSHGK